MSRRSEQAASLIKRAVQDVLARGLEDPRYKGLVTITSVRVTEDLRDATVFVSVLPVEQAELTMHALKHAAKHIRHEVSERIDMRRTPFLSFKRDESLKRHADVLSALSKIAEERAQEEPEENKGDGET